MLFYYQMESDMENETLTAYQEISGDKPELNDLLLSAQP